MRAFIGNFVVVYFDDILVYNKILDEHVKHLRCVLNVLRHEKLYANFKNVHFAWNKFFSGYILSTKDIKMNEEKVKTIKE